MTARRFLHTSARDCGGYQHIVLRTAADEHTLCTCGVSLQVKRSEAKDKAAAAIATAQNAETKARLDKRVQSKRVCRTVCVGVAFRAQRWWAALASTS